MRQIFGYANNQIRKIFIVYKEIKFVAFFEQISLSY